MTNFIERTNTLLCKNISLTLHPRKGWCWLCVMRWARDGDRLLYWPHVLLAIAALLSRLGWGCSTVGHWGPKDICLPLALNSASCHHTDTNWLKPSVPWLYYCLTSPASAVLLLIYTGASLDWRLGRGSICYTLSGCCLQDLFNIARGILCSCHQAFSPAV